MPEAGKAQQTEFKVSVSYEATYNQAVSREEREGGAYIVPHLSHAINNLHCVLAPTQVRKQKQFIALCVCDVLFPTLFHFNKT